jgi:nucleoside-triphosphatase THEP1
VRTLRPVLIVGPRHAGKTACARLLVERAREAGLAVAGFLSEGEWQDGEKVRYHLRELGPRGRRLLLAGAARAPGLDLPVGRYHLSSAVLAEAGAGLRDALAADLICIDEVGPLELDGGGFAPALDFLLGRYTGILLITARPRVAAALAGRLAAAGRAP